ncbi:dethiobiotin synthetase [Arthrobacter alpinus]|uniref:ATP-dependent dethiobiotin synthetase BioD n=1 Tax=Arthrobacter alpinus TaxID=656366 RepID=A0A1H5FUJ6_9MICC|nr:dethiobiotin synthase [Arthrobacter alpinus]SEE07115.1 dethiobiotin synthetase [Arthrobacter alpinus]
MKRGKASVAGAELPGVVLITGTDTDVGKTVATAALAAALQAQGACVAVYKPVQTGVSPGDGGDMGEVRRLAGTDECLEGIRLTLPMAPVAAAVREAKVLPALEVHAAAIADLADKYDHVLVEGAGGLLVALDGDGNTIAELARALEDGPASPCAVVVVCRSGLGTLNHTLLTLEALAVRGLNTTGLVVGAWPRDPSAIELDNRVFLEQLPTPLLGCLPEKASALSGEQFRAAAPEWLRGRG